MKILLLLDNKIEEKQVNEVIAELVELYEKNCDVTLTFLKERRDFSDVPKEWYDSDSEGIKKSYIEEETKKLYGKYQEAIDSVVFFVHKDHWNLTGVWGWNLSKVFNGYSVQQCRFDNRNLVNSIGTLYHELHHDHDTFIYTYTGKRVEDVVKVVDWDDDVTHGGRYSGTTYGWKYIRNDENQESLKLIAPLLRAAIAKRRTIWDVKEGKYKQIISLLEQTVILYRQLQAKKRGDIAIKEII